MKLVTIDNDRNGALGAILTSGEVLHINAFAAAGTPEILLPHSMVALLEAGVEALQIVRKMIDRCETLDAAEGNRLRERRIVTDFAITPLLAPIPRPGMILAVGLNYHDHLREMKNTPVPKHPTAFTKAASSITGSGSAIRLPPHNPNMVDYEGELAFVFARTCHQVSAHDALDYVAGYSIFNDVSARDWVAASMTASDPWQARLTWEVNIMGKQFETFSAMGPSLVTVDEIADSNTLNLTTRVNGNVLQNSNTSNMIFPIAEIISYFSRWYTFRPGDVVATGTPAGVGFGRTPQVFLKRGDVVDVEISGLGVLTNRVE